MQSKNSLNNQKPASFIEQARRNQIIEATIEVLARYGYVNTSFARIGKHAGISPSLISYHFKNKEDLTDAVLKWVIKMRADHVQSEVAKAAGATDKLRAAIEADMMNLGAEPKYFQALSEVIFSKRSAEGSMVFLGDQEDPALTIIRDILKTGQQNGEFGDFDADDLACIIDGARDTFLAQLAMRPDADLKKFTNNLIIFALTIVKKEQS